MFPAIILLRPSLMCVLAALKRRWLVSRAAPEKGGQICPSVFRLIWVMPGEINPLRFLGDSMHVFLGLLPGMCTVIRLRQRARNVVNADPLGRQDWCRIRLALDRFSFADRWNLWHDL
jgi:hypothetical protein